MFWKYNLFVTGYMQKYFHTDHEKKNKNQFYYYYNFFNLSLKFKKKRKEKTGRVDMDLSGREVRE